MDTKTLGELVESEVIEAVEGLRPAAENDDHYDAKVEGSIDAEPAVYVDAPASAIDDETEVEIKACLRVQSDGQRGRFYIRETQHRYLLDHDGVYLLAVYDAGVEKIRHVDPEEVSIAGFVIASASTIEHVRNPWYETDDREKYTQICWSNLSFDGVEAAGDDARAEV